MQTQEGAAFTSEGSFQLDLVEGAFVVNLLLRNSVNADGVFAGRGTFELRRVSDNAAGGSGVVNLTGTLSGNHLTFTRFEGPIGGDGCRFTATASLNRSRAAIPYPLGLSFNNPHDFDRDSKADLLWQNILTGTVVIWGMDGSAVNGFGYSGKVPAPWKIMGIGDVNGNGQADVIWQNQNSQTVAVWFIETVSPVSVGFPGSVSPEWKLKAVGDLNGDTKADLIWVNTNTGQVGIWLMNGHAISNSRVLNPVAGDWASWQLKGVGDVDANGKGDVIWHNSSTGQVAVWLMDGTTIVSMGFPGAAPTGWEMAGFGDLDGYGTTDIVWRNIVNGAVAVWFMNGGTIGSVGSLGGLPLAWHITQVSDGNADEKDDVVWQHDNGTVAVWLMNGTAIESVGFAGGVGSGWRMQPQN
jgi:hypothetical protein